MRGSSKLAQKAIKSRIETKPAKNGGVDFFVGPHQVRPIPFVKGLYFRDAIGRVYVDQSLSSRKAA